MAYDVARVSLAPGVSLRESVSARPGGRVDEARFLEQCDQCGECLDVCPDALLIQDRDGFPEVAVARGTCTRCGMCADVCTRGAIERSPAPADGVVDREALRQMIAAAAGRIMGRGG